jgi:hypothetical protein
MDVTDLIGPWLTLLAIVAPLVYAERWIHQHMYGIGYLITLDKARATTVYYLFFFPGVFLHEAIQWLAAGVLNVPVKKLNPRPQAQDNGTIRYDFVTIEKTTRLKAMMIGGLPFILAALGVYYISTSILDLHTILDAFGAGDIRDIGSATREALNTPDFWLWMYLLFTISNGMIPTKDDREGWWLILGAVGVVSLAFLIIGFDQFLTETFTGPVHDGLQLVNTALLTVLGIDLAAIFVLGMIEDTLERVRGQKMDYSGGHKPVKRVGKREPGSNEPLPKGTPLPSIYHFELPAPPLPAKREPRPKPAAAPAAPAFAAASPAAPARSPALAGESPATAMGRRATGEAPRVATPDEAAASPPPFRREPVSATVRHSTEMPRLDVTDAEVPPARPAFRRPETPAEALPGEERPAQPTGARPFTPPRPAFGGDPGQPTSAVAPFRRAGADESESPFERRPASAFSAEPRREPPPRDDEITYEDIDDA